MLRLLKCCIGQCNYATNALYNFVLILMYVCRCLLVFKSSAKCITTYVASNDGPTPLPVASIPLRSQLPVASRTFSVNYSDLLLVRLDKGATRNKG